MFQIKIEKHTSIFAPFLFLSWINADRKTFGPILIQNDSSSLFYTRDSFTPPHVLEQPMSSADKRQVQSIARTTPALDYF